jgi:hypothetical protein
VSQTFVVLLTFFLTIGGQNSGVSSPTQSGFSCQGTTCLKIYNVHVGTRCGTGDSIEVDYANDSDTEYLRGYVVFFTPTGVVYSPTDIMKPGEKREGGAAWVCHGNSVPLGLANTGSDPSQLHYPHHD